MPQVLFVSREAVSLFQAVLYYSPNWHCGVFYNFVPVPLFYKIIHVPLGLSRDPLEESSRDCLRRETSPLQGFSIEAPGNLFSN